MSNDDCPVCGSPHYYEYIFALSPLKKGKMCCNCGYECLTYAEKKENVAPHLLSEYCGIPCDLCSRVFGTNGDCPPNIETCGGEKHWKLLLERIESDGTAKY